MSDDFQVLAVRHYKERLSKCTLQPLVGNPGIRFVKFTPGASIDANGHTLLEVGAPVLTAADNVRPLLLLDSTWRYLPAMRASLLGTVTPRALPHDLPTAYPRRARLSEEPIGGLASIEALYAALRILGRRDDSLLDAYHWRREFLAHCEAVRLA